ncbi:MAG: nitrate reductase, partial [Bacteroidetes bacterium]
MKPNRREFIKISGLGLGGLALAGAGTKWAQASILDSGIPDPLKATRTPTYCEVCFWKCAGWAYTHEDGSLWKLEGHADDPHCNGRLCPRGTGGVGMY